MECGGDEDHDDFRREVRGLPGKSARNAIYSYGLVSSSIKKGDTFDPSTLSDDLPVIMACDPAWRKRDYTAIWIRKGFYARLVEYYQLQADENHALTYYKMKALEKKYKVDAVNIDQAEGTAVFSMAQNDGKPWEIFNFSGKPI